MSKVDFNLYLVTDRKISFGGQLEPNDPVEKYRGQRTRLLLALEAALDGGVSAVQLREKDLSARELFELAMDLRKLTEKYKAMLFINDRVDVAIAADADGVHLPESGMRPEDVRDIAGDRLLIGASAHTVKSAVKVEEAGADFITFGPVFDTPSKRQYGAPVGIESLSESIKTVALPVFAIGGITPEKCPEVINAGAKGVALISGIIAHENPSGAARNYLEAIGR